MVIALALGPYAGKETGETALFRSLFDQLKTGDLVLSRQFKGVRTQKRVSRPLLTLAESSCIVIQRMPNKAFNTDGEYAAG
jgi:hypothetical protein